MSSRGSFQIIAISHTKGQVLYEPSMANGKSSVNFWWSLRICEIFRIVYLLLVIYTVRVRYSVFICTIYILIILISHHLYLVSGCDHKYPSSANHMVRKSTTVHDKQVVNTYKSQYAIDSSELTNECLYTLSSPLLKRYVNAFYWTHTEEFRLHFLYTLWL